MLAFSLDDLTILLGDPKVDFKPLGNAAQNAPKIFSTAYILRLAANPAWLDKASEAIRKHHLRKRKRYGSVVRQAESLQRNLQRNLQQTTLEGQ